MKKGKIIAIILLSINTAFAQNSDKAKLSSLLPGQYLSHDGLSLYLNANKSFIILKKADVINDLTILGCDTFAKGSWSLLAPSILKFKMDTNKITYSIKEEIKRSKDSVYIDIRLPDTSGVFKDRFDYQYGLQGKEIYSESRSNLIALNRVKTFFDNQRVYSIDLIIQDLIPNNIKLFGKCYQQCFFHIPNIQLHAAQNYFTITLLNFSECYVTQADINNEIAAINNKTIYWRDIVFVKVK